MSTTKPASDPASPPRGGPGSATGVLVFILVLAGAAACWLHNRDILSDLYDYSSMITAAGKVEAGLRPYTDFRSTMQSACYVLPRLVEIVAGRSYLGLTWGGLALSLGGALATFLLLRGRFGALTAALLAGALTWAGFAQHVVIFYNPLGLLCLAVVLLGLAPAPGIRPWRQPRIWLVAAALVLGGMTKLNFQALSLGLGALLLLRAAADGTITWRQLAGAWFGLVAIGALLPLGLELGWTGASPARWYFNVVDLAEARVDLLRLALSPRSYLVPTYTLHHHVLFKSLHTVALLVLLAVTAQAWRRLAPPGPADRAARRRAWLRRGVLLLLAGAGAVGGVLLTITNIEIITLTSLGILLVAVAIAAGHGLASDRRIRVLLGGAALLWMVVGGYAAWVGARVLYGREVINRSKFVRLEHAPQALRYLEGVRLDADLYESLLLTAKELKSGGDPARVLFGPSLEWLERAYPQSIVRGMPVWYDLGTSLRESDGEWLVQRLEAKGVDRIFVHPNWESWPSGFHAWLAANFRSVPLGRVVKLYERRADLATVVPTSFASSNALALIDHTGSQIHVRTTRVPASDPPAFQPSPWGEFYGCRGGWTWLWQCPCRIVAGNFIATLPDAAHAESIAWRIVADPDGQREVLWSGRGELTAAQPELRAPFRVEPNGRNLAFEIQARHAAAVVTGWRDMRILDAADVADDPVPPGLAIDRPALRIERPDGSQVWLRTAGDGAELDHGGLRAPFELWSRGPDSSQPWRATLSITPEAVPGAVTPVIMLLWYKSGRLELLDQFAAPVSSGDFVVTGRMPERGGWVGIAVRAISPGQPLNARIQAGSPRFGPTP